MGVDQHHLTWCGDAAQDLAGLRVSHSVEGGRLRVGLLEVDRGVLADVEGAPVDHRTLAGLVDVEGVARLADAGLPRVNLATGGQLVGGHRCWARCLCLGWAGQQARSKCENYCISTHASNRPQKRNGF